MSPPEASKMTVAGRARRRPAADTPAYYREQLRLRPESAGAHSNLGNALAQWGRYKESVEHYLTAIRLRPDLAGVRDNYGIALKALGRADEARDAFAEAVRLAPDFAEARLNLAGMLVAPGEHDEAMGHLREAVRLKPGLARAHANLGFALAGAGDHAGAEPYYREAIRLAPGGPEVVNNLGNSLRDLGRLDEAEACYREAVRLAPRHPGARNNLGNILADRGRLAESLECYAEAIRLRPDYAEARKNRAHAYLAGGDYARGFAEYEWRLRTEHLRDAAPPSAIWDGGPLDGRTILLRTEQGLGDTIQFIRYAPMVKAQGGRVVLECEPGLMRLLEGVTGVDVLVPIGSGVDHDVSLSLPSLPHVCGTTLGTVPAAVPYLSARPDLVEKWRGVLAKLDGFKVGIAWQGNPKYKRDRERSIPLARFEPLAAVPGVRLINLQKGPGARQMGSPSVRFPVAELGGGRDGVEGAFCDTAAIMKGLDLVVTSDTAVAHLAGALGVPVWVALGAIPDWRWMLGREDSPWYPTMRLFRQRALGRWEEPFERMAGELRARLAPGPRVEAVPVLVSPGELLDKIAILEIKRERFDDPSRLFHVEAELARLVSARDAHVPAAGGLGELVSGLKRVNEALWDVENEIRRCERDGDFGPRFVELARSVGRENGRRADLKRRINDLLGASVYEQKHYL